MHKHEVIEICAGAGGQALGLEKAGFHHKLAIELDKQACETLRKNRPKWLVRQGDVADPENWKPKSDLAEDRFEDVALLAGGVPCPPFTIAGKQLGASDERDLFAWAVEKAKELRPKVLMLENVRGLSLPRFAGYRQHVLEELEDAGYVAHWELLQASDYGVAQLRPRFVLVALQTEYAPYWEWPEKNRETHHVGDVIFDLIASNGWKKAEEWREKARGIAPTIVGGSKKHGGADLGPTRAKRAWAEMYVDAMGVADNPPAEHDDPQPGPKLTTEMVARIQGWTGKYSNWEFTGRKTSRYRQIGNAFPPPVAHALGKSIINALNKVGPERPVAIPKHDPISQILRKSKKPMTAEQLINQSGISLSTGEFERRIALLAKDFEVKIETTKSGKVTYELGDFQAFMGQDGHIRYEKFEKNKTKIS